MIKRIIIIFAIMKSAAESRINIIFLLSFLFLSGLNTILINSPVAINTELSADCCHDMACDCSDTDSYNDDQIAQSNAPQLFQDIFFQPGPDHQIYNLQSCDYTIWQPPKNHHTT